MASVVATNALVECMKGTLDLDGSTLKIMLLKSTYTPNPDHKFVSDLTPATYECNATNYTGGYNGAGRKTLSGLTVTEDTTNNRAVFDAADPSNWTALGGTTDNTLQYAAIIKEITNDAASLVVAVLDFGTTFTTNGGDFGVSFSASGIFYTQH